jgi:hypothetical protein
VILVILFPLSVIATWDGPYALLITSPVTTLPPGGAGGAAGADAPEPVVLPPPDPPGEPLPAAPADDPELVPAALTPAEAVELVCERNDNSRIRPATVLPKARTARRMNSPIDN